MPPQSQSGLQRGSAVVEVYASGDTGSWTILLSTPNGLACLLAAGQNWAPTPEETAKMWQRAREIWENLFGQLLAGITVLSGHSAYFLLSGLLWAVDHECSSWICTIVQVLVRCCGLVVLIGVLYYLGFCHCDWVLQWTDALRACSCTPPAGRPRRSLCPKRKPPTVCCCAAGCCTCLKWTPGCCGCLWCWLATPLFWFGVVVVALNLIEDQKYLILVA